MFNVEGSPPAFFVLHSADGVNWSRDRLDDLAGAPVAGLGGLRVTDGKVIVAAHLADELNEFGKLKQVLLVGTPKA